MEPPERLRVLWLIRFDSSAVAAELWTHPHGWEVRVLWNGQLSHSQVFENLVTAHHEAHETRKRLEGVAACSQRTAADHDRFRSAWPGKEA
jgi:hypothetical protein